MKKFLLFVTVLLGITGCYDQGKIVSTTTTPAQVEKIQENSIPLPSIKDEKLDNGADPNMNMGEYEFKISPLRYAFSLANDDFRIAEELLKHGANGDELEHTIPGVASLNAYFRNTPAATKLLEKYGFNRWYLEDPEKKLELTTKIEILNP